VKITALLSWFDEAPSTLAACISSLGAIGVDHLVAVDGRYLLYQDDRVNSGSYQHMLVQEACRGAGIGLTLHVPTEAFAGNEVEKRTLMFQIAEPLCEMGRDWLMVMDADQVAHGITPGELKQRLTDTELNVGEVMFTQEVDPAQRKGHDFHMPPLSRWAVPVLFRATPGLHCERNHYTYRTGDGRYYWGQNVSLSGLEVEPTISLEPLTIEHRPNLRPLERLSTKDAYYKRRDRLGIEWPDCDICKTQPSTESVPYDFQAFGEALQAGAVRVCEDCKPEVDKRNRARLRYLGFGDMDPSELVKQT
jgi:hypothetical protein